MERTLKLGVQNLFWASAQDKSWTPTYRQMWGFGNPIGGCSPNRETTNASCFPICLE